MIEFLQHLFLSFSFFTFKNYRGKSDSMRRSNEFLRTETFRLRWREKRKKRNASRTQLNKQTNARVSLYFVPGKWKKKERVEVLSELRQRAKSRKFGRAITTRYDSGQYCCDKTAEFLFNSRSCNKRIPNQSE